MTKRIKRLNQLLRKQLGKILLKEGNFPKDCLVTLTRVETTVDLREAKAWISVLPENKTTQIMNILRNNIYHFQQKLNKLLRLKTVPRIKLDLERKASATGYRKVAGLDEAGRGPLAGPVAAAAVIIRDAAFKERIDDSKKLTERMRERAYIDILKRCDVGIGVVEVEEIDRINIYNATLLAMKRAIEELEEIPDYLLIDGRMDVQVSQKRAYLVRGESQSASVACASIVAKVFRDKLMTEEDKRYPQYGFGKHKGYGTRQHIEAIREYGLSPIHRKTFGPFGGKRREKMKGRI